MCGICGIFHFSKESPINQEEVRRMNDVIYHRGPDDEGFHFSSQIGLGMRRLSIIDLGGGRQPIGNEDGTIQIVFNGEIYNYLELKKSLESLGHKFKTNSDTEVIVHAYEEYGADCPNKLNGMFAFAIWNSKNRKLFLARDRIGKKPLYYHINQDRCVFGSELKSLLQARGIPRQVSPEALDLFFNL